MSFQVHIREAAAPEEVRRCRELAARVHGLDLEADPDGGWPERWLMAVAEQRLVATVGLGGRSSCVRWFEADSAFPLAQLLREVGAADVAELRFLSVDPAVRGYRFARFLLGAAYSRDFLFRGAEQPLALLHHARASAFPVLERVLGVRTRLVQVPSPGAAGTELRLLVPDRDVPARVLERNVPSDLPGRTAPRSRKVFRAPRRRR